MLFRSTGLTLRQDPTIIVDIEKLGESFGFKRVQTINPYKVEDMEKLIKEEMATPEPSLIIARAPCALLKTGRILEDKPLRIKNDVCMGCRTCISTGCPALEFVKIDKSEWKEGEKKRPGYTKINEALCV